MSHTSWSTSAAMGSTPSYHLDPSPGGLPVFSPDGHWRWVGDHWELREDPDEGPDGSDEAAAGPAVDPEAATDATASLD